MDMFFTVRIRINIGLRTIFIDNLLLGYKYILNIYIYICIYIYTYIYIYMNTEGPHLGQHAWCLDLAIPSIKEVFS